MTDDSTAKQWVNIRVPITDRDHARDTAPDDATYGDCLRVGADALSDREGDEPLTRQVLREELARALGVEESDVAIREAGGGEQ